jgi:O-antigen/teichoic acid export membrane protein
VRPKRLRNLGELIALGMGLAGPRFVTLISLPLAYAHLGSDDAGRLAVIEAATIYIPVLGGLAFATYAQRFVAAADADRLIGAWNTSISVTGGLGLLAFGAVAVLQPDASGLWLSGVLAAVLMGTSPAWLFRGLRRYRVYQAITFIQVGTTLVVSVGGILLELPAAYFLGAVAGCGTALAIGAAFGIVPRPNLEREVLREAFFFVPSQAAIQLYISADLLLVRLFMGLDSAAVYGTIYRAQYAFTALYALLQQYLIPRLHTYRLPGRERSVNGTLWIAALGLQWTTLAALLVTHTLLPEPFRESWYLVVILLGQISIAIAGLLPVLFALIGRPSRYALITAVGAAVNIGLNYILIPTAGLPGAALATCVSELFVVTMAAHLTNRLGARLLCVQGIATLAPLVLFLGQVAD